MKREEGGGVCIVMDELGFLWVERGGLLGWMDVFMAAD